jgi:hypothetical protein
MADGWRPPRALARSVRPKPTPVGFFNSSARSRPDRHNGRRQRIGHPVAARPAPPTEAHDGGGAPWCRGDRGASVLCMLLRSAQREAFARLRREQFVDELALHLPLYAPRTAACLTATGLRQAICAGIEIGSALGFEQRGPLRFLIEVMVLFGAHFARDPAIQWAGATLGRRDFRTPMDRAEALHADVAAFLARLGDERDHTGDKFLAFAGQPPAFATASRAVILHAMTSMFPRRVAACGDANVLALIDAAIDSDGDEVMRRSVTGLLFGHAFESDPFLMWPRGRSTAWMPHAVAFFARTWARRSRRRQAFGTTCGRSRTARRPGSTRSSTTGSR